LTVCNRKMAGLLANRTKTAALNKHLAGILRKGIVEKNGCFLLRSLIGTSTTFSQSGLDRTGYENFINHVHISSISQAWQFANKIASRLKRRGGKFSVTVSFDGKEATVRFHKNRSTESAALNSDLESYREAIAVIQ